MTVELVAVTGFLGAGKTRTIAAVARRLEAQGRRVAIVTNDQGEGLVDTTMARAALESGDRVAEVTGGCFCCRFSDLVEVLDGLVERDACDVVLAEAVGSCTDLQATVVRPMQRLHADRFRVAPLLTVLDPARLAALTDGLLAGDDDLAYLFERQLAEADVIAVNKADTGTPQAHAGIVAALRRTYPDATVLGISARGGTGLDELTAALTAAPDPYRSLEVDYDRYAGAEAALAWLNAELTVTADPLRPADWGAAVLRRVSRAAADRDWVVGHVKVLLTGADGGPTKLSLTAAGAEPSLDLRGGDLHTARVWLNARVACAPEELDAVVRTAVTGADDATAGRSAFAVAPAAFRPGYPTPTHRIPAATPPGVP